MHIYIYSNQDNFQSTNGYHTNFSGFRNYKLISFKTMQCYYPCFLEQICGWVNIAPRLPLKYLEMLKCFKLTTDAIHLYLTSPFRITLFCLFEIVPCNFVLAYLFVVKACKLTREPLLVNKPRRASRCDGSGVGWCCSFVATKREFFYFQQIHLPTRFTINNI